MLTFTALDALMISQRLVALAVFLQALELILIRRSFQDDGIWRWPTLRAEFAVLPAPVRAVLGELLPYPRFIAILFSLMVLSASLVAMPTGELSSPAAAASLGFLALGVVLVGLRWRGSFNGGSDSMTLVVLLAIAVARAFAGHSRVVEGCLAYIAIQVCLSYFFAGWSKIGVPSWRTGLALQQIVQASNYDVPARVRRWLQHSEVAAVAAWGMLAFECLFPLALLGPWACLVLLSVAFVFHLANVYVFGLNRFVYAWVAAYPALYYCALRLAHS